MQKTFLIALLALLFASAVLLSTTSEPTLSDTLDNVVHDAEEVARDAAPIIEIGGELAGDVLLTKSKGSSVWNTISKVVKVAGPIVDAIAAFA